MTKKPDFTELTKKFDLGGIVSNIKSMINAVATSENITVDPNDAIGTKIVSINELIQQMVTAQTQQAKDLAEVGRLLNELFRDVERLRQQCHEGRESNSAANIDDKESENK